MTRVCHQKEEPLWCWLQGTPNLVVYAMFSCHQTTKILFLTTGTENLIFWFTLLRCLNSFPKIF